MIKELFLRFYLKVDFAALREGRQGSTGMIDESRTCKISKKIIVSSVMHEKRKCNEIERFVADPRNVDGNDLNFPWNSILLYFYTLHSCWAITYASGVR